MGKMFFVAIIKDGVVKAYHLCHSVVSLAVLRNRHEDCNVEVYDMDGFDFTKKGAPKDATTDGNKPARMEWATKVECVETGETWPSVAECHRQTGLTVHAVRQACIHGKSYRGFHFRYIKE